MLVDHKEQYNGQVVTQPVYPLLTVLSPMAGTDSMR